MIDRRLREAIALLRDENLCWSEDFESMRLPLAALLDKISQLPTHQLDDELDALLVPLLAEESHFEVISDALERWVMESARQLGVVEYQASRSKGFRDAVKRLFGVL